MVNGSGVLRTKKATNQPVTVYARLNGITGQTALTITSMTIQSLAITPSAPTIAVGTKLPFSLIGTFSDGVTTVDLTRFCTLADFELPECSDRSPGRCNRSKSRIGDDHRLDQRTDTCNGDADHLQCNRSKHHGDAGDAYHRPRLIAAICSERLFSDGSTLDITSVATWTSSTPTVAVVNQKGVASSASHGQTNINATFKSVTGSTLLNVN